MKKLLLIVVILVVLSYGIYRVALSYAADQIVQQISEEVLTDEVIIQLKSDPQIQALLKEFEKKDTSDILTQKNIDNLPFSTKEEAVKTIIGKFSIGEIRDVSVKASRGLTLKEQAELETMVMERLTSEEIEALLIIGITEISEELLN